MSVLARENTIGILREESPTETATTEEEAGVEATAGVVVEAGARNGCGIEIETGAGVAAEVEREAEVMGGMSLFIWLLVFKSKDIFLCLSHIFILLLKC